MQLNDTTIDTPPRDAASVVLLREGASGPEVLLLRRHASSQVLGGAYVFPGGKLERSDSAPATQARLDAPAATLHAAPPTYPPRAWTSADGKSKFEGNLMEFSEKEVRIRRSADFNQFKVPLDRLSAEDQAYIRGLLREQRRDASLKEGAYAEKITGEFTKGVSKQGLNYQIWGNPKLDGTKRYPLIIWLHGSGQSGDDNTSQLGGAPQF